MYPTSKTNAEHCTQNAMSRNHIEALTEALTKAKSGELSDREFQVSVLQGLISLKESHVSLRSRLFNLEGREFFKLGDDVPSVFKVSSNLNLFVT